MNTILTLTMNPAVDLGTSIDHVSPNKKLRCDDLHLEPGGGGVNVARAMKRLETSATAIFPSGGVLGHLYEGLLDEENVAYESVETGHGMRRVNTNIREKSKNRQYRFCTPGIKLTEDDCERIYQFLEERLESGTLFIISGSLPPGVGSDFYFRLARCADEKGSHCILDAADAMTEELAKTPLAWITPNKREFEQLVDEPIKDRELENVLEDFVAKSRVRNVLLTLGSEGILYAGEQGLKRIHPPEVDKVSAVGAGDSAVAGLACALARGESHKTAIQWAVAAGAAAVMTAGSHLLRKEDFDDLREKIAAETVS